MQWVLIVAVAVVFVFGRLWVRRWIARQWLDDGLTNRQAAILVVGTYLLPYLVVAGIIILNDPRSIPLTLLILLLIAGHSLRCRLRSWTTQCSTA